MNWTEKQIRYIILEMAEENTLACKALFSISNIRFTTDVKTMSVTLSGHPELLINMDFCKTHLKTEKEVKTVLIHEFLHVILLHTEKYRANNPFLNIALDAIINAIIFRYMGMDYAGLFVRLYPWKPLTMLLRPAGEDLYDSEMGSWISIHRDIYAGKYCADDLHEFLQYLQSKWKGGDLEDILLLGEHTPGEISDEAGSMLDGIMEKMNGTKIWSKSRQPGTGDAIEREERRAQARKINTWNKATRKMLRKCLMPDPTDQVNTHPREIVLPMISHSDRRSMSRFMYSRFIPFSVNQVPRPAPAEKATVYLDVSGSMDWEIDRIISLLHHFRTALKMPLYVFSDEVYEAKFRNQQLIYHTTFGTRIEPVFNHIRKNKIGKCMIVTDGYISRLSERTIGGLERKNIHILISSEGNPAEFTKNGFPYQQLKRL